MSEQLRTKKQLKPEPFTTRMSLTGTSYPRCQKFFFGVQCEKITYSSGLCYQHYQNHKPRMAK